MAATGPVFVKELAARLGYSEDYLRRHVDRLVADVNCRMPSPMPLPGWQRWDRQAIEAWLARRNPPAPANDSARLDELEAARAMLHQAYGATR